MPAKKWGKAVMTIYVPMDEEAVVTAPFDPACVWSRGQYGTWRSIHEADYDVRRRMVNDIIHAACKTLPQGTRFEVHSRETPEYVAIQWVYHPSFAQCDTWAMFLADDPETWARQNDRGTGIRCIGRLMSDGPCTLEDEGVGATCHTQPRS